MLKNKKARSRVDYMYA